MPIRRPLVAVVVGLCAVVLAGCGGGPSATAWAGTVCDTLIPWRASIADLNRQAQQQVSTATTPEQTRDRLLALLTGAQDATERARTAIAAAGTPDVDHGADVAGRFVASLVQARDAYAHAVTSVRRLPTAPPGAFYDGVVVVLQTLNQEYARSAIDTTALDSPELRDAFDGLKQCR